MSIERILNAESVAVIGASQVETKRGYQAVKILLDEKYKGKIYPVNPGEKNILGLKCFSTIADIESSVDLALITTPARTIPDVLKECGLKGIKGAVIIAGGFKEAGDQGENLELAVIEVARENNIRIIGPNTSGIINFKSNMNLVGIKDIPKGEIALVSQSGNMALALLTEAKLRSLKGFSYYIGIGNEADISFGEYLNFFQHDAGTKAILLYVEGMRNGREFLQQAHKTCLTKPIILLKSGRSAKGMKSAGSHTGALAGMHEVAKSAFERAGIIVIEDSDKLFPAAETLSSLPPIRNNKICILADGGGHATIAADIIAGLNVELPELHEKTQAKLRKMLPSSASTSNPVDVAGGTDSDPSLFADCAEIILKDHNVGGLLLVGLFGGYGIRFSEELSLKEEDAAHQMGKMVATRNKPIIVHSLYNSAKPHSLHLLRYYGITVYDSLDVACKCIGVLSERGLYLQSYHAESNFIFNVGANAKPEGDKIIENARSEGRSVLLEHEAKQLLFLHGAQPFKDQLVTSADEAVAAANAMDSKVALKIVSPDILHKSDAKGVHLNLKSSNEIRKAYKSIMKNAKKFNKDADIRGALVSPMVSKGVEVIIGTKFDDQFEQIIMYGLGGILVEIIKDVTFRVLPISPNSAKKMICETKSYPILKGIRGESPYDEKAIRSILLMCSDLIESYPEIYEMDLNPVIVHNQGVNIVDARIILTKE